MRRGDPLRRYLREMPERAGYTGPEVIPAVAQGVGAEKMQQEARKAKARSQQIRSDLQDQAVAMFSAYRRAVEGGEGEDLEDLRATVERGLKASIRQAYGEQFRLGKRYGWNWEDLDAAEEKFVQRLRREEYVFVKRFLDDIESGNLTMPLEQRAGLYGNAGDEAFWQGYLYADQSRGRYIHWRTHEAESCPDCLFLAGELPPEELAKYGNPNPTLQHGGRWGTGDYSAQELARLAIVPQGGELRCTTNCQCELEATVRPKGTPQTQVQRVPFRSLAPKHVEPEYEKKRSRYRTKRIQRDGTVERGRGGLEKSLLGAIWSDIVKGMRR